MRFLGGEQRKFDYFAQCALKDALQSGIKMRYSIALSYVGERALSGDQGATVLPEGVECVPPKFAISKRNEWLIKNADYAIVYVENRISNCGKLLEKAAARGIKIINVANLAMEIGDQGVL